MIHSLSNKYAEWFWLVDFLSQATRQIWSYANLGVLYLVGLLGTAELVKTFALDSFSKTVLGL